MAQAQAETDNQVFNFAEYDRKKGWSRKVEKFLGPVSLIFIIIGLIIVLDSKWKLFSKSKHDQLYIKLYTHNIRNDNPYPVPGERRWEERKEEIAKSVKFNGEMPGALTVVGMQEVLFNQVEDILYQLNNGTENGDWTYYGVGREDGKQKGEFAPIFFKKSQWQLIESRTFWLSETPDIPSVGWDDALERIVTMVTLKHKEYCVNFFNTHFDHVGVIGRKESAVLIANRMENYNVYPSFLTGDFNSEPDSAPYRYLIERGFKDSRTLTPEDLKYGYDSTYTSFDYENEATSIIDYIWAPSYAGVVGDNKNNFGSDYKIKIHNYGVLHSHFGFYMSDHRPVTALYSIEK